MTGSYYVFARKVRNVFSRVRGLKCMFKASNWFRINEISVKNRSRNWTFLKCCITTILSLLKVFDGADL